MSSDPANHSRPRRLVVSNKSHPYIVGVFLMMVVYGLYLGRDFLTPVFLAFILATTLTPVVRFMGKRGVPSAVAATILIAISAMCFAGSRVRDERPRHQDDKRRSGNRRQIARTGRDSTPDVR